MTSQHYTVEGQIMETDEQVPVTNNGTKAPAATWFDLKPDRKLLNPQFEGYKLSLDSFTQYRLELDSSNQLDTYNFIESSSSSASYYIYQHIKLYGMQNLLHVNQYHNHDIYYFDVNRQMIKIVYSGVGGQSVVTTPSRRYIYPTSFQLDPRQQESERTHPSLRFVDAKTAVVCDGYNSVYFIEKAQSEDSSTEVWTVLYKWQPEDSTMKCLILKDAILHQDKFHLLLMNVQENEELNSKNKYNTIINWITLNRSDYSTEQVRKINCKQSVPDYAYLETNGKSVYLVGPEFIQFSYDSKKPVSSPISKNYQSDVSMRSVNTESDMNKVEKFYTWSQTSDEINVSVRMESSEIKLKKSDIKVELKSNHISVYCFGKPLLTGQLSSHIKADESTWILNADSQPNSIEFTLVKTSADDKWSSFLKDQDKHGEYRLNDEQKAIVEQTIANIENKPPADIGSGPLFTLDQQLEECDGILNIDPSQRAQESEEDGYTMLRRLDGETHSTTHKTFVNENKFLFDFRLKDADMPALCLRHDVDGIVWQANQLEQQGQPWLTHQHTFYAFGYVQASKQDAKYRSCSPSCSYVCIADTRKHLYIYKQDSERVMTQLRNRKTGQSVSRVSKQFLVSLDTDKEIHGLFCSEEFLIVLVHDTCYFYKIFD